MPYEPLHHKYRPQTFAQLVGQEAIATTLSNALERRRIAPAYLFSGPRGTGKTSSARILAKSLNCLSAGQPTPSPCGECEVCRAIANGSALDVIEIDAASNTGVDNIRELIERSQFAPVQCRYKVYVIDECHMLSVAAFNALLKTLEEPPAHVVFVLATTDPQRVLPTIISRCQRFDYRRIPLDAMVAHLRKIAHIENINIPLESVTLIAQIANGGLRDAESLLDQLSLLTGEITPDKVWDLVGAVPERDLLTLIQVIRSNNPEAVIQQCRNLLNRGREPLVVLQNLASFYLNLLIAKTAPQRGDLIAVTQPTWQELCEEAKGWDLPLILKGQQHLKESEYQLKNTTQPRLWLEITLLGLLPSALANMQVTATETVTIQPAQIQPKPQAIAAPQPQPTPTPVHPFGEDPTPVTHPFGDTPALPPIAAEIRPAPTIEPAPLPSLPVEPHLVTSGNGHHHPVVAPIPEPEPLPTAEAIAPQPAPVPTSSPTISALERQQLWETMLAQLQPPTTQHLLRQQGCLVNFTGTVALIGIKSQPLLNIAKSKQTNIETAFQKAVQHPVRVTFQVGHEPNQDLDFMAVDSAPIAPVTAPPPPTPIPTPPPPPIAPVVELPPRSPAPAIVEPPPVPPPVVQPVEPPTAIAPIPNPVIPDELDTEALEAEPTETDAFVLATRQFAELFAGEVIELQHLTLDDANTVAPSNPVNPVTAIAPPPPEPITPEKVTVPPDPEDDIPF